MCFLFSAVDMCAECDVHARCIHGKCVCKPGYEGDGYSCVRSRSKSNNYSDNVFYYCISTW